MTTEFLWGTAAFQQRLWRNNKFDILTMGYNKFDIKRADSYVASLILITLDMEEWV